MSADCSVCKVLRQPKFSLFKWMDETEAFASLLLKTQPQRPAPCLFPELSGPKKETGVGIFCTNNNLDFLLQLNF